MNSGGTSSDEGRLAARLTALEQALAAEQARRSYLEQVLANVNDAVIVVDLGSSILEWNAAAERIYGWSASEVRGRTLGEIVLPRYLDGQTDAEAFAALERDGVWMSVVAHHHRDGHEVLIESAVRHLRGADGKVIGLVGINRDVTARATVEEALRRSEANLRAVFESAPEAHFLLDPDFRILAFNHVAAEQIRRIWGCEPAEGDSLLTYSNPADRDAFIANARRCLQGEAIRLERPIAYPSGRTIWYEVAYTPVVQAGDGTISGLTFSGLDVTTRKQAELTLAHREAQLAGIIDSAMDAIITVDSEQRIVLFNRAAEQMFGCTSDHVLGQPLDRFIPSELRAAHRQHIPAFGETGATRRSMHSPGVLEAVRDDGTRFPIEASISQIRIEGERFYTVILRDISQRHALEAQLLHAQKLESVGLLAGGIAHDFNNLLTVISGITELMREELPREHPLQADLAEISLTTERAVALSRQLLAFARRQVLAPRVLNLNALIRETEPLLGRLLGEEIKIVFDLWPGAILVRADLNQIQQVLINLAVNARDAMPDGGHLRITTRLIDDVSGREEAPDTLKHPVAQITVQDTGVGMAPEVQAHIFEPFYTTKAAGQGSGLGLATSYGIVTQHNGQITVSSRVGEGSIFTISLPTIDAHPEEDELYTAAGMPGGTETILLVEDEQAVRAFVERVLLGLGYTVRTASNGSEALHLARQDMPIDLLVTDMVMPELSGPALVTRLASERPELRVIYMSANSERAIPGGKPATEIHLLQKPFSISALAHLVRAVLDGQV